MVKNNSIRLLLGITQQEMAMLLGVHRSQWSMFESCKRDLPVKAMVLLADILEHTQNQKTNSEALPQVAKQKDEMKQGFERLLKENEYQQLLFAKKIAGVQKKYSKHLAALHLTTFLKSEHQSKSAQHSALVKQITEKAFKGIAENNLSLQAEYEMKLELLGLEKLLILNSLRKTTLNPHE